MAATRLSSEALFFDSVAERIEISPFPASTIARYARPGSLYAIDLMYRLMGDVRDKSVLVAGCGTGETAVMLAKLGADVLGIDISPGSIQAAKTRAAINRVYADFAVSAIEAYCPEEEYDIVLCEAILHHVIEDLGDVLTNLAGCLRPGGRFIAVEPVNLSAYLRRLRWAVGPAADHTPDERPLEQAELDMMRLVFPRLQTRYYRALGRLQPYIAPRIEDASWPRRTAARSLALADRALMSLPVVRRTASLAVMWSDL